jgi:hypothetical protein
VTDTPIRRAESAITERSVVTLSVAGRLAAAAFLAAVGLGQFGLLPSHGR